MPVSEDLSSFCEVYSGSLECANSVYGDHYVNDLGNDFTKLLNIQSEKLKSITIPSPEDERNHSAHQEDARKDSHVSGLARLTSNTSLAKCATFPFGKGKNTDSADTFEGEPWSKDDLTAENSMLCSDAQSSISPLSQSKSLPFLTYEKDVLELKEEQVDMGSMVTCFLESFQSKTPPTPISAMKGSRDKIGAPPRKLTVKWAPDVYDPVPTAVSHVPNNRNQRHKSDKRNGKNKHKGGGKASRGNKGKDKKQSRKHGSSSNRCLKSLDDLDNVACYGQPRTSAVDFDVDSPDPFCGHSFLKKSIAQLHFPVAEAT